MKMTPLDKAAYYSDRAPGRLLTTCWRARVYTKHITMHYYRYFNILRHNLGILGVLNT